MNKHSALESLNDRTRELDYAEGRRVSAILDALLAGASQREVAQWARLSVNTVRAIMQDAGIEFAGTRYLVRAAEGAEQPADTAEREEKP